LTCGPGADEEDRPRGTARACPFYGAPAAITAVESCYALAIQFAPGGAVARVRTFHDEPTAGGAAIILPGAEATSKSMGRAEHCSAAGMSAQIEAWRGAPLTKPR